MIQKGVINQIQVMSSSKQTHLWYQIVPFEFCYASIVLKLFFSLKMHVIKSNDANEFDYLLITLGVFKASKLKSMQWACCD